MLFLMPEEGPAGKIGMGFVLPFLFLPVGGPVYDLPHHELGRVVEGYVYPS